MRCLFLCADAGNACKYGLLASFLFKIGVMKVVIGAKHFLRIYTVQDVIWIKDRSIIGQFTFHLLYGK